MRVRVLRDQAVVPGAGCWSEDRDGLMFTVSAAGVSELGAQALEAAWAAFIDRGVWRWREDGGVALTVAYHRADVPGVVVDVEVSPDGRVDVWLSTAHFCWAVVNALGVNARDCVSAGWSLHPVRQTTAA